MSADALHCPRSRAPARIPGAEGSGQPITFNCVLEHTRGWGAFRVTSLAGEEIIARHPARWFDAFMRWLHVLP